jgi:hypothetical protein
MWEFVAPSDARRLEYPFARWKLEELATLWQYTDIIQ